MTSASGHPLDLSPEDAQRAFQNGQAGFKKGDRVPVRTADGDLGTVEAHELAATLKGGGELASDQEFQQADDEARYGGFGNELRTGVEGAARNVTLGLSDEAMVGLGADRKALEGRKRANPWSEGIGEAAGLAGSLFIPGLGEENLARTAGAVAEIGDAAKAIDAAKLLETERAGAAADAAARARTIEGGRRDSAAASARARICRIRGRRSATSMRRVRWRRPRRKRRKPRRPRASPRKPTTGRRSTKLSKLDIPGPLRQGVGKVFEYSPMGVVGKLGNAAEKGVADVLAIDVERAPRAHVRQSGERRRPLRPRGGGSTAAQASSTRTFLAITRSPGRSSSRRSVTARSTRGSQAARSVAGGKCSARP